MSEKLRCQKALNIYPMRPISSYLFFHLKQSDIICRKGIETAFNFVKSHRKILVSEKSFLADSCHMNEQDDDILFSMPLL